MTFEDQAIIFNVVQQTAASPVTVICTPQLTGGLTEFLPAKKYVFKIISGKVNGTNSNTGTLPVKSDGTSTRFDYTVTGSDRDSVGHFFLSKTEDDLYFSALIAAGGEATDTVIDYIDEVFSTVIIDGGTASTVAVIFIDGGGA